MLAGVRWRYVKADTMAVPIGTAIVSAFQHDYYQRPHALLR